jgi:integrase
VFLRWCEREGEGPKVAAQLPKVPKKLIEILTRGEIRQLEDAAKTERDKLMAFHYLYVQGNYGSPGNVPC